MKSSFQTILLIVFGAAFLLAILIFAGVISFGSSTATTTPQGRVMVWGILPQDAMTQYVDVFNSEGHGYTITYQEHSPANFNQDLIVALANDVQPDLLLYSSEIFSQFKDKLYTIPFAAYSERLYRDTNIDGAQIFLTKTGPVGFPLLVDPMVVYYNKDILAAANFVVPPMIWSDLAKSIPLFVRRGKDGSVTQSAVALGETQNIPYFKDILSTLFLQTGNPIVSLDATLNQNRVMLATGSTVGTEQLPSAQALTFYTTFSNPTSSVYTWNRSLPSSIDMFLSGRSAFYIGRASELFTVQARNPNLNFDVIKMFQADTTSRNVTFGSFIAAGVLKSAPNFTAAYAFATELALPTTIDTLSKKFSLPPVRRDLLLTQQDNPYVAVFFKAALGAFSWPDPDPTASQEVFRAMITNVTSGRNDPESALYEATRDLQSHIQ